MMRFFRLLKIIFISLKFGLDEFVLAHSKFAILRKIIQTLVFFRNSKQARGERLRLALEALGPIFVKFGQMLSTRRDLIPLDIADELAKLQDQVPPFDYALVESILIETYKNRLIKYSANLTSPQLPAPPSLKFILLT